MGLKLYIIRHADAEKDHYDRDFERQITQYGKTQCESTKKRLRAELPASGAILCSAATRTVQTLEGLDLPPQWEMIKTKKLYEADIDVLGKIIEDHELAREKNIILVGHNPFVSDLASYLSGSRLRMGTCDVCVLTCDETNLIEAIEMMGCWEARAI